MEKKYKQTYKSKRQDYRKGGRVQKAKGGVNTRSVEPNDILDTTCHVAIRIRTIVDFVSTSAELILFN